MKVLNIFRGRRPSNYYNSIEFYQRRPDLAPRNIYMYYGRFIDMAEVDKHLRKSSRTFALKEFWNKIASFFQPKK